MEFSRLIFWNCPIERWLVLQVWPDFRLMVECWWPCRTDWSFGSSPDWKFASTVNFSILIPSEFRLKIFYEFSENLYPYKIPRGFWFWLNFIFLWPAARGGKLTALWCLRPRGAFLDLWTFRKEISSSQGSIEFLENGISEEISGFYSFRFITPLVVWLCPFYNLLKVCDKFYICSGSFCFSSFIDF